MAQEQALTAAEGTREAAPAEAESLVRELLAGLVAAAIALACFLPPLVHFISGPLGPAIAGFIVAQRVKPGARGVAVIAGTLGLTLAGFFAIIATAIVELSDSGKPPDWFPATDQLALILAGVAVYAAALGAIGTAFGARHAKADTPASSPS
jgi:hypothetical protein